MTTDGAKMTTTEPIDRDLLRHAHKISVLGKMLGGIAHDLNNSLTVMLMNVDALLQELDLSERQKRRLGLMMNATQDGTRLVRTLLAFTQQLSAAPEIVCVAELLPQLAELARRALGEEVGVELELPPEPWYVTVDIAEFEVAVLYLALHIGDRSAGTLALKLANIAAAEGDRIQLQLVRTGNADTAAASPPMLHDGGLGLDAVSRFVRDAGGSLDIETRGSESIASLAFPRTFDIDG